MTIAGVYPVANHARVTLEQRYTIIVNDMAGDIILACKRLESFNRVADRFLLTTREELLVSHHRYKAVFSRAWPALRIDILYFVLLETAHIAINCTRYVT